MIEEDIVRELSGVSVELQKIRETLESIAIYMHDRMIADGIYAPPERK